MQIKFSDDFLKNQYKKLSRAYRAKNIASMACYFTNITLRYGGAFATELSQFIEKTEKQKQIDFAYESSFNGDMGNLSYFLHKSMAKNRLSLFLAIERNNKKIRKQEEAPEVKTKGAESLPVVPSDYGCCDWCHVDLGGVGHSIAGGRFVCSDCAELE
ncbi:hypothetical protein [Vibrio metschnikovii]|uniref:hypothetical protein n=1 Tax=Vibrio metschnikovii TaxID=28172 RepID=UPI001C2F6E93|nr:hypothetical protein [Vibrio metschnikovii]